MGTDIYGFIECRWDRWLDEDDRSWHSAVDLAHLYNGRSYAAFGCLFGVRSGDFPPLAAGRGLPSDASAEVRADYADWGGAHSASWITWAEIAAADWEEAASEVDACVHEYRRRADGAWEFHGRNTGLDRFAELAGPSGPHDLYRAGLRWPEGTEWRDGERLLRIGRLRRKHVVDDSDWGPVWAVMRTLAGVHGEAGVRLVVWFGG
ncbi:hypothetical protein [Streptomyces sp. NPDC090445]|uniref:hypothetical protein n=1 Tax=Streptomyces sp. NPDC090445 TaxID=3365963 RepID=UPI003800D94C